MQGHRPRSGRKHNSEEGIIIILAAVFMLFVMGAMAALSIDVVTFYAARSEAQLAADSAALAGARALANSGMTSSTNTTLTSNAVTLATNIATQVAQQNQIGGSTPTVAVSISTATPGNPHITVRVSRNDLPTFFARIWGSNTITTAASATAEAYNPSLAAGGLTPTIPVATSCVKPWVLPNLDPNLPPPDPAGRIFDQATGAILDSNLLGWQSGSRRLRAFCNVPGNCPPYPPQAWQYYQGNDTSFPHPTQALPACTLTSNFQTSIAGCVQKPISCGDLVNINIVADSTLDTDAATAVDCLANTSGNSGDWMTPGLLPPTPFEFRAGDDDPLVQAGALGSGDRVMVSDSLVTVPIVDNSTWGATPPTTVQLIGFVQLFLQPSGNKVPGTGIRTKVINLVGCGTSAAGTPIYGNGASAVPVRLIAPPPAQ